MHLILSCEFPDNSVPGNVQKREFFMLGFSHFICITLFFHQHLSFKFFFLSPSLFASMYHHSYSIPINISWLQKKLSRFSETWSCFDILVIIPSKRLIDFHVYVMYIRVYVSENKEISKREHISQFSKYDHVLIDLWSSQVSFLLIYIYLQQKDIF